MDLGALETGTLLSAAMGKSPTHTTDNTVIFQKAQSHISTVFGRISCSRQLIFTAFNDKVETTPMGVVNLEYKTHLRLPVVGLFLSSRRHVLSREN